MQIEYLLFELSIFLWKKIDLRFFQFGLERDRKDGMSPPCVSPPAFYFILKHP